MPLRFQVVFEGPSHDCRCIRCACRHKAHCHGFLFTLRVRLGNVEHWSPSKMDPGVTFASLQCKTPPVDSVHIPRKGGDEYIVYHSDQVQLLSVQMVQLPAGYPHGKPSPGCFQYPTTCTLIGPQFPTSLLMTNAAALDAFISFDPGGAQRLVSGGGGGGGGGGAHRTRCRYAPSCYQADAAHWAQYDHPGQAGAAPQPMAAASASNRRVCKYAPKCSRHNPEHWQECAHPGQTVPAKAKK